MRRVIVLLTMVVVASALSSGIALAATIVGTDKAETLTGTRFADYIRAEGGADKVEGRGGPDQLYGNGGPDKIFGGFGKGDHLHGGRGDDRLMSQDIFTMGGRGYRDVVDCGPGHDFARVDRRDRVRANCEEVSYEYSNA